MNRHDHDQGHEHDHDGHGHRHGGVDPSLASNERGLKALRRSLVVLGATAALQAVVVFFTGSVALLADTIHNVGDALTAVPLAAAFILARRRPSKRFPYGLGRAEDLAGLAIMALILLSAAVAAYEAVKRIIDPEALTALLAVALAGFIGFLGNEAVALFRMRVGREIGSAALVADGRHARIDGLTSLAVVAGAAGVALGFPLADPLVGLAISAVILRIVWDSGKEIVGRALDGVEDGLVDEIREVASRTPGVVDVGEVRARWLGHSLRAEVNVAVDGGLDVAAGHELGTHVRYHLLEQVAHLDEAIVHVDPDRAVGEAHHNAPMLGHRLER